MAVFEVAKEAVSRARSGEGPTLIEAQTYRYYGHFGADDTLGYRTQEEQDYYTSRDCITAVRSHILDGSYATETELLAIDSACLESVEEATKFADESPFPEPEELTKDVYISYGVK